MDTPTGPSWHRYSKDGYGEDAYGTPYQGTGIRRAWPLLTGQRGHYEIAAGNINKAKELLKTTESFANNGLLSEQIWDGTVYPIKIFKQLSWKFCFLKSSYIKLHVIYY